MSTLQLQAIHVLLLASILPAAELMDRDSKS